MTSFCRLEHVRSWPKADVQRALSDDRFWPLPDIHQTDHDENFGFRAPSPGGGYSLFATGISLFCRNISLFRGMGISTVPRIAHEFLPTTRKEKRPKITEFPVLSRETANCAETVSPQTASTAKKTTLYFNDL